MHSSSSSLDTAVQRLQALAAPLQDHLLDMRALEHHEGWNATGGIDRPHWDIVRKKLTPASDQDQELLKMLLLLVLSKSPLSPIELHHAVHVSIPPGPENNRVGGKLRSFTELQSLGGNLLNLSDELSLSRSKATCDSRSNDESLSLFRIILEL